jgi:hypothetical protein
MGLLPSESGSAGAATSPVQTVSLRKSLPVGRRATELVNEGPLVAVPDFTGLAVRTAAEKCETVGLELVVAGSGLGHKQKPVPGTLVPAHSGVWVEFSR